MRGAWQATIVDDEGNVQPFASVEVRNQDGAIINLFDAETGGNQISNPFDADNDGFARFYCDPQLVDIEATTASGIRTWDNVLIPGTAASQDVEVLPWLSAAIGEPKAIMVNDPTLYPPTDNDLFRYIILTEGLDGVGDYNEGQLINETITGSGVEREVTAEIASGPLAGTVVHLVNSENSFIRPGETAGEFKPDQMQRVAGRLISIRNEDGSNEYATEADGGAFTAGNLPDTRPGYQGDTSRARRRIEFDSANSPDARTSTDTDGETAPKHVTAIYFMRKD